MSTNELSTGVTTESWRADLLARAEEARRRRVARQRQRRPAAGRRAHGMVERNAARLAEARRRSRAGPRPARAWSREDRALRRRRRRRVVRSGPAPVF